MKLIIIICVCVYVCVGTERNREINHSNPTRLTNFKNFKACLDNFDIHYDKIIRTEDSRAIGAKYISESDMNTREECLRFCCVTDTCDVFVFEEKKSGSCYLFNCGSPADFKCKFTKHHNYTSGVLALGRRMTLAQELEKTSKHEQELNQLRRPEGASATSLNLTFGATTQPHVPIQGMFHSVNKSFDQNSPSSLHQGMGQPASEHIVKALEGSRKLNILSPRTDPVRTRQCSRFQYKCRSTGECIAIYNACDGIPQCSDGSDESSDLGCPTPVTSSILPMVTTPRNKTEKDASLLKAYDNPYRNQADKTLLPEKVESADPDLQSESALMNAHTDSANEQQHTHNIQLPISTSNLLKPAGLSHVPSSDYESLQTRPNRFRKPDDSSEINSPPEFSGFRQYLTPQKELDSRKVEEDVHNYITAKLMAERNKDMEHTDYSKKTQDINLQSRMKSTLMQQQSDLSAINKHNEQISLFQDLEHDFKPNSPPQTELKQQQQANLANALRHQLTNVRIPEMQSDLYQNEHVDSKEAKALLRSKAQNLNTAHLGTQQKNIENVGSQREVHFESDTEHQLRNEGKEQPQVSYQETSLQDVPGRSYKYEDEDRHIFNHKGYDLVADSDSSEIPYRLAVPNVEYKLNNIPNKGSINNIHEYRNQIQKNIWADQIHPTSHVLKVLKNNPQTDDSESGYPISSDYLYDETQHSILNAVSLIPHRPNSGHHLSPLHSSVHFEGSLERPSKDLLQGLQSHQDNLHEPINKIIVLGNPKSRVKEGEIPKKMENSVHESGKHADVPPAIVTSNKEALKQKSEGKHPEHFVSLQQAYISELPNDQQEDRPSGALLSMSFGLCITFVMVVLVACRLRIVKRRLRRNGKSLYAHDADYLVNGMYL